MNLGIGLGVTNYLRVPTVPLDPDAAIAALFALGEEGAWYDPSDSSTVWQDAAGTTPAGVGDPVGRIDDKSGNGNHATQSTSAARPVLQTSGGLWYLDFDGVDDRMVATFAATVNRPADIAIAWNRDVTASGYIYTGATADGRLFLQTYNNPPRAIQLGNYDLSTGAAGNWEDSATSGIVDAVVTARFTATSPYRALRINGASAAPIYLDPSNGADKWDGITLGSTHASSTYSNFNLYSFVGINRTLTAGEITDLESYLATKSGVTL